MDGSQHPYRPVRARHQRWSTRRRLQMRPWRHCGRDKDGCWPPDAPTPPAATAEPRWPQSRPIETERRIAGALWRSRKMKFNIQTNVHPRNEVIHFGGSEELHANVIWHTFLNSFSRVPIIWWALDSMPFCSFLGTAEIRMFVIILLRSCGKLSFIVLSLPLCWSWLVSRSGIPPPPVDRWGRWKRHPPPQSRQSRPAKNMTVAVS